MDGYKGGWIEIIAGGMFSGKSEELIRRLRRALIARQRVQVFKPIIDDRFSTDDIVSRDDRRLKAIPVTTSAELLARVEIGVQVVGIDEVQFFDPGVVDVCMQLADAGIRVIAAGLDQDFMRRPFGPMPALLAVAEDVSKMHAVCVRCRGAAHYSQRVAGGNARTAEYLGLHISRRMVIVLALSGAIAGLAGAIELTGVTNRLQDGISVNYGYSGVLIAFLARGRLLGVVVAAFLFATLVVGSYALQTTGVAQPIATIIEALIIVFLLAGDAALAFRVHMTRPPHALEPATAGVRS